MSSALKYIFKPKVASLAIVGSAERFPVRRIFCIGKNYAAHVVEMGGSVEKDPPLLFSKPADAVVDCTLNKEVRHPPHSKCVNWEGELVVALKCNAPREFVSKEDAKDLIFGCAVGVDLTARDLQDAAKKGGRPWDMAKGFDESAPIGPITPVSKQWITEDRELSLTVNGELKQKARLSTMIWSVPDIIAELSRQVRLESGDLIFTGTPKGVDKLNVGDLVVARVDGLEKCEFRVAPHS